MTILGQPKNFHIKQQFLVEFPGLGDAHFKSCSALEKETAIIIYWEGGTSIPHKRPGRTTYSDLTLERGTTNDEALHDWFEDVANASAGIGLPHPGYKRDGAIRQLDQDDSTLMVYAVNGAWPSKYIAAEWDADSDEVVMESLTVTFDYFERKKK